MIRGRCPPAGSGSTHPPGTAASASGSPPGASQASMISTGRKPACPRAAAASGAKRGSRSQLRTRLAWTSERRAPASPTRPDAAPARRSPASRHPSKPRARDAPTSSRPVRVYHPVRDTIPPVAAPQTGQRGRRATGMARARRRAPRPACGCHGGLAPIEPRGPAACRARRREGGAWVARAARGSQGWGRTWSRATSAPSGRNGRDSSIETRLRSSASAAVERGGSTRCRSPGTSAARQSHRGHRQNSRPRPRSGVLPEWPNASHGSRSQPMPERSANMMPPSTRRSSHRGGPSASGARWAAAAPPPPTARRLPGVSWLRSAECPRRFCWGLLMA